MKIGLLQISSAIDYRENLKKIRNFIPKIKESKIEALFLPECFYSLSNGLSATPYLVEEKNEHMANIQSLAKEMKVMLIGGSVATKENDKIYNRVFNISPQGEILSTYDKRNLFAVNLKKSDKEKESHNESKIYSAGNKGCIQDLGPFKVGISVCFDLRFPELYRSYFKEGANVLSISSAFTVPTGKAHWHTLVRARAIENQSYVIACGQVGKNNERINTFGHSLIVDPWGEILVDAKEDEDFFTAEISMDTVKDVRSRMKVPLVI